MATGKQAKQHVTCLVYSSASTHNSVTCQTPALHAVPAGKEHTACALEIARLHAAKWSLLLAPAGQEGDKAASGAAAAAAAQRAISELKAAIEAHLQAAAEQARALP